MPRPSSITSSPVAGTTLHHHHRSETLTGRTSPCPQHPIALSIRRYTPPPNTHFPDSIEAFEIPHIQVVAMSKPVFWSTPLRYMRWAANERPAIFYSILMGSLGPVALVALPPIRRYFGDVDPAPVPMSYPIPPGPRKIPQGYDDE
ncbi:hypothetical protein D8B26_006063 [Coccidioides posadasii str. Silveira]|uniref:uncharacterized protein n=1 Tax=Coccidioides posadasii (strain RMSCC 757 / Silveira) TaxID=443226 RepID=UPI001BED7879|nr:hypothetical protein D8B26_006063 [Coccidioides posadasii str. Silveira]